MDVGLPCGSGGLLSRERGGKDERHRGRQGRVARVDSG